MKEINNFCSSQVLETVVSAVEVTTDKPRQKSGNGYRLQCPYHEGKGRNLWVGLGDKKLIIRCHSQGCDPKDIVESVGLTLADIYYERLSGKQLSIHNQHSNRRQIQREAELELIILLYWISDFYAQIFPIHDAPPLDDSAANRERVALAWQRIRIAADYFTKEGVK